MDYKIWTIDCNDPSFVETCDYIEEHITKDNLVINGGTLNYSKLTYQSELLTLVSLNGEIIGYNSLVYFYNTIYIFQIAVKKEYQQKGIGTMLMEEAIRLAKEKGLDVTANVMEYNTNSKKMFERLGFEKISVINGDGSYIYTQPKKDIGSK